MVATLNIYIEPMLYMSQCGNHKNCNIDILG